MVQVNVGVVAVVVVFCILKSNERGIGHKILSKSTVDFWVYIAH